MSDQHVLDLLAEAGRRSASLHRESRKMIVDAVRSAASSGMSQRQIARAVGRSQPEISRLLRFQPSSARGRRLSAQRRQVIKTAAAAGFTHVRVFGSVARGDDHDESDVDLLASPPPDVSLFAIARLEMALQELLQERVEVVPDTALRAPLRDRVLAEAVPL